MVGLSILSGSHLDLVADVLAGLHARGGARPGGGRRHHPAGGRGPADGAPGWRACTRRRTSSSGASWPTWPNLARRSMEHRELGRLSTAPPGAGRRRAGSLPGSDSSSRARSDFLGGVSSISGRRLCSLSVLVLVAKNPDVTKKMECQGTRCTRVRRQPSVVSRQPEGALAACRSRRASSRCLRTVPSAIPSAAAASRAPAGPRPGTSPRRPAGAGHGGQGGLDDNQRQGRGLRRRAQRGRRTRMRGRLPPGGRPPTGLAGKPAGAGPVAKAGTGGVYT